MAIVWARSSVICHLHCLPAASVWCEYEYKSHVVRGAVESNIYASSSVARLWDGAVSICTLRLVKNHDL